MARKPHADCSHDALSDEQTVPTDHIQLGLCWDLASLRKAAQSAYASENLPRVHALTYRAAQVARIMRDTRSTPSDMDIDREWQRLRRP